MPTAQRVAETGSTTGLAGARRRLVGFIASILVSFVALAPSAEIDRAIEYWTIEPNEGRSAGGHAAIRIGERVYHVEHRGDGLIVDRRDDRHDFERAYRLVGNRAIEALSLDLPRSVEEKLDSVLRRRYFERQQRTDRLAELEEDLRWLEGGLEAGAFAVEVPGAGLFTSGPEECTRPEGRQRAARKARLVREHGVGWLEGRLVEARRRLHRALGRVVAGSREDRMAPHARGSVEARPVRRTRSDASPDPIRGGLHRDVVEAAQAVAALEVVIGCRSPAPDRLKPIPIGDEGRFGPVVRAGGVEADPFPAFPVPSPAFWWAVGRELEADLSRLLGSQRPDAGLAIALAWGRLAAIDRTRSSGVPTFLDPIAEAGPAPDDVVRRVPSHLVAGRLASARRVLKDRLERLATDAEVPIEARLFGVEAASHALAHATVGDLHRGADRVAGLRVTRADRYPAASIPLPWPKNATLRDIERRRDDLAEAAKRLRKRLDAELGYALVDRNCVTELLAALDEALRIDPGTASFGRDRRRDGEFLFSFIPVVAGRVAKRHLPNSGVRRLPSWREWRLSELRSDEGDSLAFRLRESNTLSARTYWASPDDSVFLFFTRDPVWSRPLAGIANLAAGTGATLVGFLRAPLDRGRMLRRGLQGVLMSVPELFFFNIRKGSYLTVPGLQLPGDRMSTSEGGGT